MALTRKPAATGSRIGRTLQAGIATMWVVVLTLWQFLLGLWCFSGPSSKSNALEMASVVFRTTTTLWFTSFFPALAFGLAWYAFSFLLWSAPAGGFSRGQNRIAIAQVYSTLCTGICVFLLTFRVVPLLPLATNGAERQSAPVLAWSYGQDAVSPVLERQLLIGVMAAALVAMQVWFVLPRIGGRRSAFAVLASLLLAGGLAAGWLGVPRNLHRSVPQSLYELDDGSALHQGLLLGDPNYRDEAELALATFFRTHADKSQVTSLIEVRREWLPDWPISDEWEARYWLCELCRLPGVALWTTHGLPLLLGAVSPADPGPMWVLEVPRGATTARVYQPGHSEAMTTVPLSASASSVHPSDWVVLKIDFAVPMKVVATLLAALRDQGVRRVDLAVVPHGFAKLPSGIPRLSFDATGEEVLYEPRPAPLPSHRGVILVRRYVPPPPRAEVRRPDCSSVDRSEYLEAWSGYALDPPGSLPAHVRLPLESRASYGDFVALLQGAIRGGAETVVVTAVE